MLRRWLSVIALTASILLGVPASDAALADRRVALVIGNDKYQYADPLESCIKDALDLGDVLDRHGYSTRKLVDATRAEIMEGIAGLQTVGREADICIFYFSGHGLEVDGINYLSPVDGILRGEADLTNRLVPVEQLLLALRKTEARRKIVILDCCRNNPFEDTPGGLAAIESGLFPRGTLIAYAGSPGVTVSAGPAGENSVYTRELLRQLSAGRDVFSIFTSVSASRFRSQDPWLCFDGSAESLGDLASYDLLGAQVNRPAPGWPSVQAATPDRANTAVPQADPNPMKISSYWDHNGSTMGLLVRGNQRILIYIKVREGLRGLVEPGMVLFDGVSEGGRYKGTARRFSKGLKPLEYPVSGPILGGGNRVLLTGKAPIRNPDGTVNRIIDDELEFTYLRLGE